MPLDTAEILILLAVGLLAGTLGGMLGIGGSVIMIPAMAVLFHHKPWDNQHLFQASAMVVNMVVAVPAMRRHRLARAVPGRFVHVFLPTTVVFIVVGVMLSNMLAGETLRRLFALFLLYVVASNLRKALGGRPDFEADAARIDPARGVAIGGVTGIAGGVLGIGGGIVSVPLMQLISRLPLRTAIAASASTMVFSSAVGAAFKLGTLDRHGQSWVHAAAIALALAPTALAGGHIGAGLTHRVPVNAMRIVLAVVLTVMAGRMAGII